MDAEKEVGIAEHLLSLIEKKNIWDLDIISSILDIDPNALLKYVKTLPMAYGISISGSRLSITYELVRDVKEEIKTSFINWYQRTVPDSFSQKQMISSDVQQDDYKKKILEEKRSSVKITVFGENYLVQKMIDNYLSRPDLQPTYSFAGGYEPISFEKVIGNDKYECQFSVINSSRDLISISPLLYESPAGFLFIFNPLDPMQIEKIKNMNKILTNKRDADLFMTFLAILPFEGEQKLVEITETLTKMIEDLEDIGKFKVSFAILTDPEQIARKINDLIQISKMLAEKE